MLTDPTTDYTSTAQDWTATRAAYNAEGDADYHTEADALQAARADLDAAIAELDARIAAAAYLSEHGKRAARAVLAEMADRLDWYDEALVCQTAADVQRLQVARQSDQWRREID
jgi:hypothetical protein